MREALQKGKFRVNENSAAVDLKLNFLTRTHTYTHGAVSKL